ncbi:MAG TPA: pilus assembly protein TadG-related protein [Acidimicrobiia bacterium]
MNKERGSVTLWILGLTVVILGFGGVALDFWRALAMQRALAAIADAATVAAASGIDELHYRNTGEVILDPYRARTLGAQSIASQNESLDSAVFDVSADGTEIELTVIDSIEAGFIRFFTGDDGRLVVRATSRASPILAP